MKTKTLLLSKNPIRSFSSLIFKLVKIFHSYLKSWLTFSNYPIILIFIIALFLRLLGTNPGYPSDHPDEPTIVGSVRNIALDGNFKPVLYSYGSLLYFIYALIDIVFFIPRQFLLYLLSHGNAILDRGFFGIISDFQYTQLRGVRGPLNFLHWTRYETAILSSFAVILTYFLGKKMFNKEIGLITAFLVAINYRHIVSSVMALVDSPASFFALLSLLLSVNLLKNSSTRSYIYAGVGLALALSVKYFIYIIPSFLLCHILVCFKIKNASILLKIRSTIINKKLISALIVGVFVFCLINPYLLLDFKNAYLEYQYDSSRFAMTPFLYRLLSYQFNRSLIPLYYLVNHYIGGILISAIVLGYAYILIKYFKKALILSSVILPFLFIFLIISAPSSVRYYSSIMPFLLFFPAILIYDVSKLIHNKKIRIAFVVFLTVLLGFQSIKNSFLTTVYFSQPHNQTLLSEWIIKNIPNNSVIATSAVAIPLNKNIKEINIDINPIHGTTSLAMEELKEQGIQWVIMSSYYNRMVNDQFRMNPNLVEATFFDHKRFWEFMENTYVSLTLNELGDFRIKEFVKPFGYSFERAMFVIKIPEFWRVKTDNLVKQFDFNKKEEINYFKKHSFSPLTSFKLSINNELGYDDSSSLYLDSVGCSTENRLSSEYFPVESNKWYSLIGFGNRIFNSSSKSYRDGFLRLDFYNKEDKRLKTYVSKLLYGIDGWQKLSAAGISPNGSEYAAISFQLDYCYSNEKYLIDHLQLYSSNESPLIGENYPYYNKELSKSFLWVLEL